MEVIISVCSLNVHEDKCNCIRIIDVANNDLHFIATIQGSYILLVLHLYIENTIEIALESLL